MTALAADTPITTKIRPDLLSYAMADNVLIYKGSLVTINAGTVYQYVSATSAWVLLDSTMAVA
jgi:hypothetical protein